MLARISAELSEVNEMSDIFRDYSFGGWLRSWRQEAQLSLRTAAALLGVDAGNLSKIERNELPPPRSAKRIDEICKAYGKKEASRFLKSIAFQHYVAELRKEFGP